MALSLSKPSSWAWLILTSSVKNFLFAPCFELEFHAKGGGRLPYCFVLYCSTFKSLIPFFERKGSVFLCFLAA